MKFFVIIKEKSERVPGKNFIQLGTKPLWRHLVDKLSGEEVFIDTDSQEILDVASKMKNITVYARLQEHIDLENSEDFRVSPVLKMIERFLNEHVDDENEIIVTPHVTSPFITLETIKKAAEKLNEGFESVQACTEHQEFAYYKSTPVNFNPNVVEKTQNLTPIQLGNGAFFIFTKKSFFKYNNRTSPNFCLYPISFVEGIEIDTHEDLEIAKKFIQ